MRKVFFQRMKAAREPLGSSGWDQPGEPKRLVPMRFSKRAVQEWETEGGLIPGLGRKRRLDNSESAF
jgi:hypothetical protein